jgi:hypothetical protein
MVAMLPLGLVGVAAGFSLGTCVGAAYALARLGEVLGIRLGEIGDRVWPPLLASLVMAAVMLPVDWLLLDPPSHGTVAALALLAVEGIAAFALYSGLLVLLVPDTVAKVREILDTARHRVEAPGTAA